MLGPVTCVGQGQCWGLVLAWARTSAGPGTGSAPSFLPAAPQLHTGLHLQQCSFRVSWFYQRASIKDLRF